MADQPNAVAARFVDAADSVQRFCPTRRQVLLGAGALLGITAAGSTPVLRSAFASVARMVNPAVGVVAPNAARYPGLLNELADGVRSGLAAAGQPNAPVFARTAASSAPSSVAAAARALVEHEKVDLVLVYANPTQTQLLGELAEETGVPVVVVDPGAHIVTSADADSRVLSHSLGYWQSTWELGSWSAQGVGPDAYMISSLYESGFDVLNAFEHGLNAAGGRIVGTSITHLGPGDVAAAVSKAAASDADSLFVACSGAEADDILAAIATDKAASAMHLLVPGIASDRLAAAPGVTATTALTWPTTDSSVFEMLGRDIGELVAAAVDGGADALPAGETTFDSARGKITLDLATGRTDVAVTIQSATAGGSGVTYTQVAAAGSTARASALADQIVPELRTGWLDVYGSSM
ncbi:MAG: ABC transporter substrate-binding protein [Actinomycetota bacterium]|nr:ABC transporter substrate-binding protein [Actinomycetota bacterium]